MSAEYPLFPNKSYRVHAPLTEDQLALAAEDRLSREIKTEEELRGLTKDMDILDRIVFSAAYRVVRGVDDSSDQDLFEAAGVDVIGKLAMFKTGDLPQDNVLTPEKLWETIPGIDPHHRYRESSQSTEHPVVLYESIIPIVSEPIQVAA